MTDHPITPPPELVGEWLCDDGYPWDPSEQVTITITTNRLKNVATQAAQWGADQELNACVDLLRNSNTYHLAGELRALRRDVDGLTPVHVLGLEPELLNPLLRGGVRTVEQIRDRGAARLLQINNLGPDRVGRILAAVNRYHRTKEQA